jgi:hypothetical protein
MALGVASATGVEGVLRLPGEGRNARNIPSPATPRDAAISAASHFPEDLNKEITTQYWLNAD